MHKDPQSLIPEALLKPNRKIKAVGDMARGQRKILCLFQSRRKLRRFFSLPKSLFPLTKNNTVYKCSHTVCHLAFDRSASNLATSLRS